MKKLYHYITKGNTVLTKGILTIYKTKKLTWDDPRNLRETALIGMHYTASIK